MGGRMSRNKGASGERNLVMHLRLLGYDARRVIRTRAVSGYENDIVPDVIATLDKEEFTFESKWRTSAYKTLYKVYDDLKIEGVMRLALGTTNVAVSENFELVRNFRDVYFHRYEIAGPMKRTFQQLLNMRKLLKGAQFLVVKDNHKKPLFIRYWGT